MSTSQEPSQLEFSDFYERAYRPDRHAQPRQAKTVEIYRTDLRNFDRAFRFHLAEAGLRLRNVQLADLWPDDPAAPCGHLRSDDLLKHAMAWQLGRGRAVTTANRLYRAVKAVWRDAFARGLVPAPPRTRKYEEPKVDPVAWSLPELETIIAAAERAPGWVGAALARDFFPAYFWFIYSVGARQHVTLHVPTDHFDPVRGEVLLPAELQKQNADQRIDLPPEAVEAILKLRSAERGLELLFGDQQVTIGNFNKRIKKLIVAAGLRKNVKAVTRKDLSHKVRKTFATHGCANSDEETIRKLLGHSHISVTRTYLDPRFMPRVSARNVVPPLRPRPTDPDDPRPRPTSAEDPRFIKLYRPEAG